MHYTSSTDGGDTWATNVRISDRSMHRQRDYAMHASHHLGGPISVASTDPETHFSWSDSRNGTFDEPAEDAFYTSAFHSTRTTGQLSGPSLALGAAGGLALTGLLAFGVGLVVVRRQASTPSDQAGEQAGD